MNSCAWCSVGIDSDEKFCSSCGGPNINYLDLRPGSLPITNIGEIVIQYILDIEDRYRWQLPRVGILRRIIIVTDKPLMSARLTVNYMNILFQIFPRVNEIVYTANSYLLQNMYINVDLEMETLIRQKAYITIETDQIKSQ